MQQLINLIILILLGFMTANLGLCFQMLLRPGMIFNFYGMWIYKLSTKSKFWDYISKPLGMCVYCHTIWLAIGVFALTQETFLHINLLLFIGITWFFIHFLLTSLNSKFTI